MNTYLKKSITLYILENLDDFQLVNNTIENFREYIYSASWEYLMTGKETAQFIRDICKLLSSK